ncbi:MAG: DNA primase [Planctomycetota bacterium]
MARIPEEVIRSVLDAVDIVDTISRFVSLKRSGTSFQGLCPFHDEKTPSFHVFPNSGRFKCFGCGEGGDAIAFLMRRENLSFMESLEELARETGIVLPREEATPQEHQQQRKRAAALQALDFAARFYRVVYGREAAGEARAYLERREFSEATIEAFSIGFSPDEFGAFSDYARSKGLSDEALFDAGLIRRNERGTVYDMFRGRIMFPIRDLRGQVIGFGARALGDAQPKYLNSADGILFHKGREMYGLHLARAASLRAGRLLVVEGYTDVMACHQYGIEEAAAGLGTALTSENARQLRRFNVPVLLVYDGDEAGRRAAERAANVFLTEQVPGAVALLPPGRDPADLLAEEGAEGLERALGASKDLWDYCLERAFERNGGDSLDGRGRAAEELLQTIAKISDPLRKDVALKLLSERTGVPEFTLRDRLGQARGPSPSASRDRPEPDDDANVPAAWRAAEQDLVAGALIDDEVWNRLLEVYPPDRFADPGLRRIAGAIGNLRGSGQSLARESLLGELAENDGAVRALQSMEPDEGARERALKHLEVIADRNRRRVALAHEEDPLAAIVRARGGHLNEDK